MKAIWAILAILAYSAALPLKERRGPRQYYPEEEDPFRFKYIAYENEKGEIFIEDLSQVTGIERRKVNPKDVQLRFFTRNNTDDAVVLDVDETDKIPSLDLFDPTNPTYFVVHGWNADHNSEINVNLKNAILQKSDSNVISVGWGKIANKLYTTSAGSVQGIGEFVGIFMDALINHHNISSKQFNLIGHSLGAHVAGCAGAKVNGTVDYIAGLDPAAPLFTVGNKDNRLDETDADFVQILHTSTSLLGFKSSIGHSDYFPNGGSSQPGCGIDIFGSCAHSRAYVYYEESILDGGFTSYNCDSFNAYKKGECEDRHASYLGSLDVHKQADGDYYLHTNKKSPYSKH